VITILHVDPLNASFAHAVDATFCQAAIECKIHVSTQLEKYLGGPVSLFTSPCIVEEVRKVCPCSRRIARKGPLSLHASPPAKS
jgi:hypothetical protein